MTCPVSPEWVSSCSASDTSSGGKNVHNKRVLATKMNGRDWSSEVVALFLDWELGRVASSCHTAMDLLCQEMREACWVGSESLGSPRSLCSQLPENFSCGTATATKPFSHRGRAVTTKERDVVREMKGEGTGSASPLQSSWLVNVLPLLVQFQHGAPGSEGVSSIFHAALFV